MDDYTIVMEGRVTEVYYVEAASEEEARANLFAEMPKPDYCDHYDMGIREVILDDGI